MQWLFHALDVVGSPIDLIKRHPCCSLLDYLPAFYLEQRFAGRRLAGLQPAELEPTISQGFVDVKPALWAMLERILFSTSPPLFQTVCQSAADLAKHGTVSPRTASCQELIILVIRPTRRSHQIPSVLDDDRGMVSFVHDIRTNRLRPLSLYENLSSFSHQNKVKLLHRIPGMKRQEHVFLLCFGATQSIRRLEEDIS